MIIRGITEGLIIMAGGNSHFSQLLLSLTVTVSGSGGAILWNGSSGCTQEAHALEVAFF